MGSHNWKCLQRAYYPAKYDRDRYLLQWSVIARWKRQRADHWRRSHREWGAKQCAKSRRTLQSGTEYADIDAGDELCALVWVHYHSAQWRETPARRSNR